MIFSNFLAQQRTTKSFKKMFRFGYQNEALFDKLKNCLLNEFNINVSEMSLITMRDYWQKLVVVNRHMLLLYLILFRLVLSLCFAFVFPAFISMHIAHILQALCSLFYHWSCSVKSIYIRIFRFLDLASIGLVCFTYYMNAHFVVIRDNTSDTVFRKCIDLLFVYFIYKYGYYVCKQRAELHIHKKQIFQYLFGVCIFWQLLVIHIPNHVYGICAGMSFLIGGVFYVFRFPECYSSKYDVFINSHQILHMFIIFSQIIYSRFILNATATSLK